MIYNQPIIEITKQGAVAVEEIKFSPPKLQSLINHQHVSGNNSGNNSNNNSPILNKAIVGSALKNKQILQLQGHHGHQHHNYGNGGSGSGNNGQPSIYSLNSLNPYYAQQVLCQFQKPHNFIKQVHVVVKNTPFGVTMKSNDPMFNFHNYAIKATLLYDSDPPKMVDFIHNEPLQYVATVSEDGTEVVVEVKVGILSSQHQGSMFLVVLHVHHTTVPTPSPNEPIMTILNNINSNSITNLHNTTANNNQIYNLCVVSHPIRIVSKVDHVKKEGIPILKKKTFHEILTDKLKKLQKFQEGQSKWIKNLYLQHLIEFDMEPYCAKKDSSCSSKDGGCADDSSNSSTPSLSSYSKNHNNHDSSESDDEDEESDDDDEDFSISKQKSTLDLLNNNIKHQQHLQQQLLNHQQLQKKQQAQAQQSNVSSTTTSTPSTTQSTPPTITAANNNSSNFQNSFNRVVEAFKFVPEAERKEIIMKMVEQLRSDDLEQLVSTFMDELGVGNNNSETKDNSHIAAIGCFCENCPSKKELERFQGLCLNFFVPNQQQQTQQGNQYLPQQHPQQIYSLFENNLTQSQMANSISVNQNTNNTLHHHHHHHNNTNNNNNSNLTNDLLQLPII